MFFPYYVEKLVFILFSFLPNQGTYSLLVGFGCACAPVRCAHLSFWAHCHAKRGAARPPPIAASLLLIGSPKIDFKKLWNSGRPHDGLSSLGRPRHGFLSLHWTTEAMKYDVPSPSPRQSQLRWSFWQYFGSFSSFLKLLLLFSSYSSPTILRLLILLFLYFKLLFVVLQTCILKI